MTHDIGIVFNDECIARPWGVFCSCGFNGACVDQEEADRVADTHLKRFKIVLDTPTASVA